MIFILGSWGFIFDLFGKEKVCYKCPDCKFDIYYKEKECKNCFVKLKWDF